MEPFLPFSAARLWTMLNAPGALRDQRWYAIPHIRLQGNHSLGRREILFSKIEDELIEAQVAKLHSVAPKT
jgi:methionyl-tRNA synthetase